MPYTYQPPPDNSGSSQSNAVAQILQYLAASSGSKSSGGDNSAPAGTRFDESGKATAPSPYPKTAWTPYEGGGYKVTTPAAQGNSY